MVIVYDGLESVSQTKEFPASHKLVHEEEIVGRRWKQTAKLILLPQQGMAKKIDMLRDRAR